MLLDSPPEPHCPCLQDSKVLLQPSCGHGMAEQEHAWPFSNPFSFLSMCFPVVTHKDM